MTPIHLIIPMSGQGNRYRKAGYEQPKPLIPVSGVPMISRVLASFPTEWTSHFVLAENHGDSELPSLLKKQNRQVFLNFIPPHELGPSYAVLSALKNIPQDSPVFVSYCDYGMSWDSSQFERFVSSSHCDSCIISYRGFHPHYLSSTQYAYSRLEGERVVEVREKECFTKNREQEFASAGGYYFRSALLLRDCIEYQMEKNFSHNGEFYTSLTVQALLLKNPQARVRVFEVPFFHQWGTPSDLRNFEFWEKSFASHLRLSSNRARVSQVLMPMAGQGSRFVNVTEIPKPLIPVNGIPMFLRALNTLPHAERTVLISTQQLKQRLRPYLQPHWSLIELAKTPAGQALSTEAGLIALDLEDELIVSSCDHGVVFDSNQFNVMRSMIDCDAAIFTITGFPGAQINPKAFTYVSFDSTSQVFPLVNRVSVKKPLSEQPQFDSLLVGTFWFRKARILNEGIQELKQCAKLVNGELYLDSIFEILIETGYRVRMFPLGGYLCWGDPNSLAEALYWEEYFCGCRIMTRPRFPGVSDLA